MSEASPVPGIVAARHVEVHLEAAPALSLAMVENNIPLVAQLSVTNPGPEALHELIVELTLPDFSAMWTTHISAIPAGGTFHVDDIELALDQARLVNQLERSRAALTLAVRQADRAEPLATLTRPIDVLAYNEWNRATVPHILAAFVLPNHPAVAELLGEARAPLARLTGDPALNGYQSNDPARIKAITQAIYEAIQARGVTYSNPPASFERTGQKIRTPEQVFSEQLGTCLDLATLEAAALEQAGLHPLVILIRNHALPAVWLDEYHSPEGLLDDGAQVRKLVALGRLLVFDSSAVANRPLVPFVEAVRLGNAALDDHAAFEHAIDIKGARKLHFRPLTMRVDKAYAALEVPAASSGPVGVPTAAIKEPSGKGPASARVRNPRVEAWKQRLLDTTLRNRLLAYKETKKTLRLLCPDLGGVEDALALGEDFTIRARPALLGDDPRSKKLLEARVAGDSLDVFLRDRLAHHELYSVQSSEALVGNLTTIYRGAREALEETGSNTLCVTLGMLDWYESATSTQKRRAPILLVPVQLVRGTRTSTFTLRATGEDARLNVTLFEKLRIDTGITLPELAELPLDGAGVDVVKVLDTVREAILNLPRWEVQDELHLGLFSFAKFQMWADLDQNLDAVMESPVVKHLIVGKGDPYPNTGSFVEPSELDARIGPRDLLCPLDADASQLAAVVAAAEGKTFVLQGPPGTGKSQTITNLIAHCIAQGKRVLFVAEKAAALDVVHRRLTQVGLAPYVLELHSHKSGKLQVLEQFKAALDATASVEPAAWETNTQKLGDVQQHLNAYVAALHQPRDAGFSIFHALAKLDLLRGARAYELPATCAASSERLAQLRTDVDNLRQAAIALAPLAQSVWHGCQVERWQVDLPQRVREAIDQTTARLDATLAAGQRLAAGLGANSPATLADLDSLCAVAAVVSAAPPHGELLERPTEWPQLERQGRELVELARGRATALTSLRQRYSDALLELELDPLAARFRKLARAFWLVAWWGLRAARRALVPVATNGRLGSRAQIADDLELAQKARDAKARLTSLDATGVAIYGPRWQGADTDAATLEATMTWATTFHQVIARVRAGLLPQPPQRSVELGALALDARTHLTELRASLTALGTLLGWDAGVAFEQAEAPWQPLRELLQRRHADVSRLRHWIALRVASAALGKAGCGPLVRAMEQGELSVDDLLPSFERSAYQAWVRQALAGDPVLSTFDGDQHARQVSSFAALDRAHLVDCRDVARARVSQRIPSPTTTATGGEMGVLQRELGKKRRQMAIRKLLQEIPALAARLKPCFLMSPMSVAQYLDPRTTQKFDLIVFDEASQIPTYDAIGTLARGTSAVVVGDSRQLPPTSFFASAGDDDEPSDDGESEELESILDECLAAGLPERRLDWHYRSRHESLIAFSNFHYYQNKLNTFPSAAELGNGRGVSFRAIDGFYDKGGSRTNKAEAAAVVADLVTRLRAPDANKRTYGIVTFSQAQQALVEDLLDQARQEHPEIETFFDAGVRTEPVIVKNLENIQGDERDVMIFSICYGPDQKGVVSMNFGPLNRSGGERRLNVAVTRAREELVVFSTLLPEKIDLTRTNAVGVKHLKTFLDYARRGPRAIAEALTVTNNDAFDSPFEQQVCERLRERGLDVDSQVGCAGYRIDLGVRHPELAGKYLLGVECDGAYYHSARSARERDRLRQQVLEGLGWTIHRIWSTDWWQDHDAELTRVMAAVEHSRTAADRPTVAVEPTPLVPLRVVATKPDSGATYVAARATSRGAKAAESGPTYGNGAITPYEIAPIPASRRRADDVHDDEHRDELRELLLGIAKIEAPVSLRVLARRIAPYFEIQRTSARLDERVRSVLGPSVLVRDDIVWRTDQDPATYAGARLATPEARRETAEVPVEEIANAAASVLRASIALEHDELVKLTARALGYQRVGDKVADHMSVGVAMLVTRGAARRDGDKIVLA